MKFLKTIKGKITVSLLAILMISSAGVVFAGSNAGDQLKQWYEGVFADTTDEAMDEAEAHGEEAVDDFKADYAARKDKKAGQLDRKRDWETRDKKENIDAAKQERIDDLEGTKEKILEDMDIKFYNVYNEAWQKIQDKAEEAKGLLNEDMEQFANTEGEAAIEQLNSDLDQAKADAVSDLQDAIENAKAEISAKLDKQGEIMKHNLKGEIDHQLQLLENTVSKTLKNLVEEQEKLITAAAEDKEAEAKDALDDVLENMGN